MMSEQSVNDHLQRLDDEDALKHGQCEGDDPFSGRVLSILKAVQQGEEGRDAAYGKEETPADKDEPPGQLAAGFFRFILYRHEAGNEK